MKRVPAAFNWQELVTPKARRKAGRGLNIVDKFMLRLEHETLRVRAWVLKQEEFAARYGLPPIDLEAEDHVNLERFCNLLIASVREVDETTARIEGELASLLKKNEELMDRNDSLARRLAKYEPVYYRDGTQVQHEPPRQARGD